MSVLALIFNQSPEGRTLIVRVCSGRQTGRTEWCCKVIGQQRACFQEFLFTDGTSPRPAIHSPPTMLSCMDSVERMCHAAARMRYHHDSVTRTIAVCVRGLQGSRERWTAPTIMDGPDVVEFCAAKS